MGKLQDVAERLLNVHRVRNGWPPTTLDSMLPEHKAEWLEDARAAIETLREPTEGMVENGADHAGTLRTAVDTWASMIDAILAEEPNGHR